MNSKLIEVSETPDSTAHDAAPESAERIDVPPLDAQTWKRNGTGAQEHTRIRPRRAILNMPEYHPPLAGRTALRLDFNENTHAPSPRVREALAKLTLESFTIYPEREPVERVVAEHLGLQPEQVLLTNAVDEAIHLVCFTFLEEGDEALFCVPSFFMYDVNSVAMGAKVTRIQADDSLHFPFERFLAAITPRTRLIILASPNNPTGTVMTREQIHAIAHAAPHALVMVDEAYFHFFGETVMDDLIERSEGWVPHLHDSPIVIEVGSEQTVVDENRVPHSLASFTGERVDSTTSAAPRNIIIARTFSKAYGLASLRAGLLAGPAELIAHLRKAASPYNVNGVALAAVEACVGDTEYLDWYAAQIYTGREKIERALDHMRVPRWPSHANFVLMRIGPRHKELIERMRDRGVLLRDRSSDPGLAGCVRITVGVEDQVDTGIAAMRDTLAEMQWTPAEATPVGSTPAGSEGEREYE